MGAPFMFEWKVDGQAPFDAARSVPWAVSAQITAMARAIMMIDHTG